MQAGVAGPRGRSPARSATTASATRRGNQLLTGLRGKDVLLVFVESYGKVAVQGSVLLAGGRRRARPGHAGGCRPPASPPAARFLTSPTFGGISWLAHSTLQSGVWVDSQRRYDQLVDERPLHAQPGVQAGRLADRRRRAVERPGLAAGDVVLPLRQALRPAQRRLPRPDLRATPRCPTSTSSTALQRLELAKPRPPPALRRGRPGVEPHAVDHASRS